MALQVHVTRKKKAELGEEEEVQAADGVCHCRTQWGRLPPRPIASVERKKLTVKQKRLFARIKRQAEETDAEDN